MAQPGLTTEQLIQVLDNTLSPHAETRTNGKNYDLMGSWDCRLDPVKHSPPMQLAGLSWARISFVVTEMNIRLLRKKCVCRLVAPHPLNRSFGNRKLSSATFLKP